MVRTKDIENEIAGYLVALEQWGFAVNKAILFGSMAKGNPHEYSDIDLAVWNKDFSDNYFLNIERTAPLKRTFKRVELHPFGENETAETNPFIEEIEHTGKIIIAGK
jgi:predicted nucleotidyltransferase